MTASVVLIGLAGCADSASTDVPSSGSSGVGCTIASSLVATLGALEDPASLPAADGMSVEVESLRDGGWLAIGGIPYLPAPLHYGPNGEYLGEVGRAGDGPNEFDSPWGLARGPGDSIWVTDLGSRIVILDPDATPTRTIPADTSFGVIEGFTSSGIPYGAGGRNSRELEAWFPLVRLYSLDGGRTRLLGPGHTNPAADWYLLSIARSRVIMETDSTALAAFGPIEGALAGTNDPVWLSRWTPTREDAVVMKSEIIEQIDGDIDIGSAHRLRHVALQRRPDGLLMSLAAVGEYPSGETEDSRFFMIPAADANAAYDGLILLLDGSEVLAVTSIPDAPVGFADDDQVFSLVEDSLTGLVSARVWQLEFSGCPSD